MRITLVKAAVAVLCAAAMVHVALKPRVESVAVERSRATADDIFDA